jgi:hypothetical protein
MASYSVRVCLGMSGILQTYVRGFPNGATMGDTVTLTDAQLNYPLRSTASAVRAYFVTNGMKRIRAPGDLPQRYGPYIPIPKALP